MKVETHLRWQMYMLGVVTGLFLAGLVGIIVKVVGG